MGFTNERFKQFGIQQTVYQGSGCLSLIPHILEKEGWKRILLVVGPTFMKLEPFKKVERMLRDGGYDYKIFSKIEPNPLAEDVENIGLPMYQDMNADVMIAIGGGSTMDSAKGIAFVGDSGKTICEIGGVIGSYDPHTPFEWNTYPIIAVPTTCGSGSEVIKNAVISEPNGHKMVPMHDCILPAYALCDPDLLATEPPGLAAATTMDAFVQAVESLVSRAANDFSRTMSFRAIEIMGPYMVKFVHNRAVPEFADAMSRGCMYAGFAWNNAFPAQIHGSNHPFTEKLHVSHGDACAMLLPWFVEWNGEVCKEDFWKVHNFMYPDEAVPVRCFEIADFVQKLIQLNRDLNIMDGKSLVEYGCTEDICREIADEFNDKNPYFPRTTTKDQMYDAFVRVMNGEYL